MSDSLTVRCAIHVAKAARGRKTVEQGSESVVAAERGRVPRVARLLALALKLDAQLLQGVFAGHGELVAKIPMTWVARALETDETRGLIKATVDEENGQILGCTVLGLEGGEVMTMVQVAMMGRLPYAALRDGTFSHPGLGECLNTLFLALDS
jgi:hypothetical protein